LVVCEVFGGKLESGLGDCHCTLLVGIISMKASRLLVDSKQRIHEMMAIIYYRTKRHLDWIEISIEIET
jgi:hypothetical protein